MYTYSVVEVSKSPGYCYERFAAKEMDEVLAERLVNMLYTERKYYHIHYKVVGQNYKLKAETSAIYATN